MPASIELGKIRIEATLEEGYMISKNEMNRRRFLATSTAAGIGATLLPACAMLPKPRTASDTMTLGKTGIKISRLGFGLGTHNGRIQCELGREGLKDLVHYAYDQGIRYIDCSQSYNTFTWVAGLIEGLPREDLFLTSKIGGNPDNPMSVIEKQLTTYKTDYIDCIMLHCAVKASWPQERERLMEALSLAKQQGKIRSHGISCHTLPALRVAAASDWVDVNLVRINPQCVNTDGEGESWNTPSSENIEPVMEQVKIMGDKNHGVIAMKLIGEGKFKDPAEREKAIRHVLNRVEVHSSVIGFKSQVEVDEAIERVNRALNPVT